MKTVLYHSVCKWQILAKLVTYSKYSSFNKPMISYNLCRTAVLSEVPILVHKISIFNDSVSNSKLISIQDFTANSQDLFLSKAVRPLWCSLACMF